MSKAHVFTPEELMRMATLLEGFHPPHSACTTQAQQLHETLVRQTAKALRNYAAIVEVIRDPVETKKLVERLHGSMRRRRKVQVHLQQIASGAQPIPDLKGFQTLAQELDLPSDFQRGWKDKRFYERVAERNKGKWREVAAVKPRLLSPQEAVEKMNAAVDRERVARGVQQRGSVKYKD